MINLIEGEHLICDACYVDLQDENLGDFDPNPRHHQRIPWYDNAVCCCCCHAAHDGKPPFRAPAAMEGIGLARFYGSSVHPLFSTKPGC